MTYVAAAGPDGRARTESLTLATDADADAIADGAGPESFFFSPSLISTSFGLILHPVLISVRVLDVWRTSLSQSLVFLVYLDVNVDPP